MEGFFSLLYTNTYTHTHTHPYTHKNQFQVFSAAMLLTIASWFQLSFTLTIPNLKKPTLLHFHQASSSLTLNNILYHTLSEATQPTRVHSSSLFTSPLHLQHIFTNPNISGEAEVQMSSH